MNNAGLWLYVKPSVGLPLFFVSVAVTSLIVHAAVLTHTSWYPAYYEGNAGRAKAVAAAVAAAPAPAPAPVVINVGPGGTVSAPAK